MKLSIIIPAFNEERRIIPTLVELIKFLELSTPRFIKSHEIIVANDGSSDNTLKILNDFSSNIHQIKVISYTPNKGKGYAIRRLIESAVGDYVVCNDADMAISWSEINPFISEFINDSNLDILIGSKSLSESQSNLPPWHIRKIMSRIFNFIVRTITGLHYKDTQCGFKMFKAKSVKPLIDFLSVDRFAWDVEFLMLAKRLKLKVTEKAVSWRLETNTRVRIFRDSFEMLSTIIRIKLRGFKLSRD